jgi:8-oxo-dGTP pyrophosphatase MutT (NUDIX family)
VNWMSESKFVVVWAIPEVRDTDAWLMVRHVERGWELPGGDIKKGEAADEAALRELFEETGKLGIARAIDNDLIEGGSVVLVEVQGEAIPDPWGSSDSSIGEVGWCLITPEETAWGEGEIERIRSHDWSASISLGS